MRVLIPLSAMLFAGTCAAQSKYPECIQTCITQNRSSSWCDGDETGEELDECICSGLGMSPMVQCTKDKCSKDDQAVYAGRLPDLCSNIFPDVGPNTSAAPPSATKSGGEGGGASKTANSEATMTSGGSEPSDTGAAVGRVVPTMVAAGGLLAALLI